MKLLITIVFFSCASITRGQVSFSLNAGVGIGNIVTKYDGERDQDLKPALGYMIPAHVNFPITKSVFLQTGVEFESIHYKTDATSYFENLAGGTVMTKNTGKSHIEYINIPFKILYNVSTALRLSLGPFIGIAVSGSDKGAWIFESDSNSPGYFETFEYDSKTKFGYGYGETNRWNAGLGFNIEYVFSNNLIVSYCSNMGLANMSHFENVTSKTISLGLTIGYVFGGKSSVIKQ
jgi:hypothetical protein